MFTMCVHFECCSEITLTQQCVSANFLECDTADGGILAMVTATQTYLETTLALIGGRCSNPCRNEPCQNQGTCTPSFDFESHTCRCQPGYFGDNCQSGESSLHHVFAILFRNGDHVYS